MTDHQLAARSQACKAISTLGFAILVGLRAARRSDITRLEWFSVVVLWLVPAALSVQLDRTKGDTRATEVEPRKARGK